MASSSKYCPNESILGTPSPSGPFQSGTLSRVIKVERSMEYVLQMLTEIQVMQIKMAKEQEKQGKILRDVQKFILDNHNNPIIIKEKEEMEEDEEEVEEEEKAMDEDGVICVGEVFFDKNGNVIEKLGNFCHNYPNCLIHKSPMFRNRS